MSFIPPSHLGTTMERFEVGRKIGQGSYGSVFLVRRRSDSAVMVMKELFIDNIAEKEQAAFFKEAELMERLSHPSVVGYKEWYVDNEAGALCIVMHYCERGDLTKVIKNRKPGSVDERAVFQAFIQLALALEYLHSKSIVHRDIKSGNVFITQGMMKLGDMGIAKELTGTSAFAQTCIGTPYYMSPELFRNAPYGAKSDVWALGIVIYELCTLKHPFDAQSISALATKILKGVYEPVPMAYSRNIRLLVKKMLTLAPEGRPTIAELLQVPFVRVKVNDYVTVLCYERAKCLHTAIADCLPPGALLERGFDPDAPPPAVARPAPAASSSDSAAPAASSAAAAGGRASVRGVAGRGAAAPSGAASARPAAAAANSAHAAHASNAAAGSDANGPIAFTGVVNEHEWLSLMQQMHRLGFADIQKNARATIATHLTTFAAAAAAVQPAAAAAGAAAPVSPQYDAAALAAAVTNHDVPLGTVGAMVAAAGQAWAESLDPSGPTYSDAVRRTGALRSADVSNSGSGSGKLQSRSQSQQRGSVAFGAPSHNSNNAVDYGYRGDATGALGGHSNETGDTMTSTYEATVVAGVGVGLAAASLFQGNSNNNNNNGNNINNVNNGGARASGPALPTSNANVNASNGNGAPGALPHRSRLMPTSSSAALLPAANINNGNGNGNGSLGSGNGGVFDSMDDLPAQLNGMPYSNNNGVHNGNAGNSPAYGGAAGYGGDDPDYGANAYRAGGYAAYDAYSPAGANINIINNNGNDNGNGSGSGSGSGGYAGYGGNYGINPVSVPGVGATVTSSDALPPSQALAGTPGSQGSQVPSAYARYDNKPAAAGLRRAVTGSASGTNNNNNNGAGAVKVERLWRRLEATLARLGDPSLAPDSSSSNGNGDGDAAADAENDANSGNGDPAAVQARLEALQALLPAVEMAMQTLNVRAADRKQARAAAGRKVSHGNAQARRGSNAAGSANAAAAAAAAAAGRIGGYDRYGAGRPGAAAAAAMRARGAQNNQNQNQQIQVGGVAGQGQGGLRVAVAGAGVPGGGKPPVASASSGSNGSNGAAPVRRRPAPAAAVAGPSSSSVPPASARTPSSSNGAVLRRGTSGLSARGPSPSPGLSSGSGSVAASPVGGIAGAVISGRPPAGSGSGSGALRTPKAVRASGSASGSGSGPNASYGVVAKTNAAYEADVAAVNALSGAGNGRDSSLSNDDDDVNAGVDDSDDDGNDGDTNAQYSNNGDDNADADVDDDTAAAGAEAEAEDEEDPEESLDLSVAADLDELYREIRSLGRGLGIGGGGNTATVTGNSNNNNNSSSSSSGGVSNAGVRRATTNSVIRVPAAAPAASAAAAAAGNSAVAQRALSPQPSQSPPAQPLQQQQQQQLELLRKNKLQRHSSSTASAAGAAAFSAAQAQIQAQQRQQQQLQQQQSGSSSRSSPTRTTSLLPPAPAPPQQPQSSSSSSPSPSQAGPAASRSLRSPATQQGGGVQSNNNGNANGNVGGSFSSQFFGNGNGNNGHNGALRGSSSERLLAHSALVYPSGSDSTAVADGSGNGGGGGGYYRGSSGEAKDGDVDVSRATSPQSARQPRNGPASTNATANGGDDLAQIRAIAQFHIGQLALLRGRIGTQRAGATRTPPLSGGPVLATSSAQQAGQQQQQGGGSGAVASLPGVRGAVSSQPGSQAGSQSHSPAQTQGGLPAPAPVSKSQAQQPEGALLPALAVYSSQSQSQVQSLSVSITAPPVVMAFGGSAGRSHNNSPPLGASGSVAGGSGAGGGVASPFPLSDYHKFLYHRCLSLLGKKTFLSAYTFIKHARRGQPSAAAADLVMQSPAVQEHLTALMGAENATLWGDVEALVLAELQHETEQQHQQQQQQQLSPDDHQQQQQGQGQQGVATPSAPSGPPAASRTGALRGLRERMLLQQQQAQKQQVG